MPLRAPDVDVSLNEVLLGEIADLCRRVSSASGEVRGEFTRNAGAHIFDSWSGNAADALRDRLPESVDHLEVVEDAFWRAGHALDDLVESGALLLNKARQSRARAVGASDRHAAADHAASAFRAQVVAAESEMASAQARIGQADAAARVAAAESANHGRRVIQLRAADANHPDIPSTLRLQRAAEARQRAAVTTRQQAQEAGTAAATRRERAADSEERARRDLAVSGQEFSSASADTRSALEDLHVHLESIRYRMDVLTAMAPQPSAYDRFKDDVQVLVGAVQRLGTLLLDFAEDVVGFLDDVAGSTLFKLLETAGQIMMMFPGPIGVIGTAIVIGVIAVQVVRALLHGVLAASGREDVMTFLGAGVDLGFSVLGGIGAHHAGTIIKNVPFPALGSVARNAGPGLSPAVRHVIAEGARRPASNAIVSAARAVGAGEGATAAMRVISHPVYGAIASGVVSVGGSVVEDVIGHDETPHDDVELAYDTMMDGAFGLAGHVLGAAGGPVFDLVPWGLGEPVLGELDHGGTSAIDAWRCSIEEPAR